jgi:hypothetical protein
MRLIHTSLATVAVLAVSGTAFAAGTKDEVDATMGGSAHVQSGGDLRMTVVRRTATAKQFRVTIKYDVTIRSKTVVGFAAHPCKSTSCVNQSISKITLFPGLRHVKFTGHVPVKRRADGTACVYAQLRDQGPNGREPGKIVRRANGRKGVTFCRTVE